MAAVTGCAPCTPCKPHDVRRAESRPRAAAADRAAARVWLTAPCGLFGVEPRGKGGGKFSLPRELHSEARFKVGTGGGQAAAVGSVALDDMAAARWKLRRRDQVLKRWHIRAA